MSQPAEPPQQKRPPRVACLVDTTRCIGCRSCQVACKQSNGLDGEPTRFFAAPGGYQNPGRFSPRTFTYVSYHELEDASGDPIWVFVKHQCMHCAELYCSPVCGPQVYRKTPSGVVAYEADNCMGCAACIDACPFQVPAIDYWNLAMPQVRKCSFCLERQESTLDEVQRDGRPLSGSAPTRAKPAAQKDLESGGHGEQRRRPETLKRLEQSFQTPACAKACPTGALQFGHRDPLLAEAKRRIAGEPDRYVDHVYGETEAGGTGWLYLARVPFEKLGFPTRFQKLGEFRKVLGATRPRRRRATRWAGIGLLATAACWLLGRRDQVRPRAAKTDEGPA